MRLKEFDRPQLWESALERFVETLMRRHLLPRRIDGEF